MEELRGQIARAGRTSDFGGLPSEAELALARRAALCQRRQANRLIVIGMVAIRSGHTSANIGRRSSAGRLAREAEGGPWRQLSASDSARLTR